MQINNKLDSVNKEIKQNINDSLKTQKPNKNTLSWPLSSYKMCFIAKTVLSTKLLLPTALIRLQIGTEIYGPFRALLDTGAQPMLISHTLFKQLKCISTHAHKALLGVGSDSWN